MIDGLPGWLEGWLSFPVQAFQQPFSALLLFAFGALHALLPGHGKAILAARSSLASSGPSRMAVALLDGTSLAGARALIAFALVIGTVQLAAAFGIDVPVRLLRVVAGCAIVGMGLHFVLQATLRRRTSLVAGPQHDHDAASNAANGLNGSLLLLGLTPEPVALAITSFGIAQGDLLTAGWAILGLALGMGLTLGLTSLLAARSLGPLVRLTAFAGLPVGLILLGAGAIVIADAW